MGKAMVAAALLLAACSSGPNYSPPQRMDPNAAALMMMYGVERFGRSIQPAPMPPAQGIYCYGGKGYMWCR